jgi:hypothetical protein
MAKSLVLFDPLRAAAGSMREPQFRGELRTLLSFIGDVPGELREKGPGLKEVRAGLRAVSTTGLALLDAVEAYASAASTELFKKDAALRHVASTLAQANAANAGASSWSERQRIEQDMTRAEIEKRRAEILKQAHDADPELYAKASAFADALKKLEALIANARRLNARPAYPTKLEDLTRLALEQERAKVTDIEKLFQELRDVLQSDDQQAIDFFAIAARPAFVAAADSGNAVRKAQQNFFGAPAGRWSERQALARKAVATLDALDERRLTPLIRAAADRMEYGRHAFTKIAGLDPRQITTAAFERVFLQNDRYDPSRTPFDVVRDFAMRAVDPDSPRVPKPPTPTTSAPVNWK